MPLMICSSNIDFFCAKQGENTLNHHEILNMGPKNFGPVYAVQQIPYTNARMKKKAIRCAPWATADDETAGDGNDSATAMTMQTTTMTVLMM